MAAVLQIALVCGQALIFRKGEIGRTMKKIVLFFIPLFFFSCAAFLNEKFDAAGNLSDSFSSKIEGIIVISFPVSNDISLIVESADDSVILKAAKGFIAYSWSVDGKAIEKTGNEISLSFDGMEGSWHLVTVTVCDANGNYYSACAYFQVIAEKKATGTTVTTSFDGTDSESISLSYIRSESAVSVSATSGFSSYAWMLDGIALSETSNSIEIDLSALSVGTHIVTVIAKKEAGIYYSANAQISKTESLDLDIKCSGITIAFASEHTKSFSVTSVTNDSSAIFTATSGFESYKWTLDEVAITGNSNTNAVSFAQLAAGWHLITVTAYTDNGVYYSSAIQVQKTSVSGIATVKAGLIQIGFESTGEALSLITETISNEVRVSASNGFDTYSWSLDGATITGSENAATIELASLETGWHLVTVTAVKNGTYYSASTYIQKKGA